MSLCSKSCSVTIQMKAIEQYFPVVLFILLYKVVLAFESLSYGVPFNETSSAVLSHVTICFVAFYKVKSENFVEFWHWLNFGSERITEAP